LNVGVTHYDVPPFGMRNIRNEYEGLSADYTGLVAWQLNLPVNVKVFSSSEEAWQALARGDIDLIPSVAAFPDNETFAFSLPYASDKPVLGLNDSDTAALAEDLHDTDVAMPRDYLPCHRLKLPTLTPVFACLIVIRKHSARWHLVSHGFTWATATRSAETT
jgi:two-component system sensor histidine kinase EvgS